MNKLQYTAIIFAVIGIIMFVAVAIPVTVQVVNGLNMSALPGGSTGTSATVINLIPLFVALGALVYVVVSVITG